MLKKEIKNKLGVELQKFRTQNHIRLQKASEISSLTQQQTDCCEMGYLRTWDVYEKLLNSYGKKIRIELCDK